jgi:hypothetical protein
MAAKVLLNSHFYQLRNVQDRYFYSQLVFDINVGENCVGLLRVVVGKGIDIFYSDCNQAEIRYFLIIFSSLIPFPKTGLKISPSDFNRSIALNIVKSVIFIPFFTSSQ